MSYFQAVRLYSLIEVCIFTGLLVTAIGGLSEDAELILIEVPLEFRPIGVWAG